MGSEKPSFVYASGRDGEVWGAETFTAYVRDRLGCEIPVGGMLRGKWYERLRDEMEIQGWDWEDLKRTVDYVRRRGIRIQKIDGVLHFVEEAKRKMAPVESHDLHAKVAKALEVEQDETWVRRLSLAQGKALQRVYEQWKEERGG